MRLLCVWLERLLTDSLVAREPALSGKPLVAVEQRKGAMVVAGVSAQAESSGVMLGVSLGDARAQARGLAAREADQASVRALYERVVKLASRYGPWVSEACALARDKLVVDVTGCGHLFGGELAMLEDLRRRGEAEAVSLRLAVADRLIAATALAEYGPSELCVAAPGDTWATLQPLPLAALGVDERALGAFARLGIRRISDLKTIPISSLRARFGSGVVQAMERAKGLRPDPVAMRPHKPPPRVRVELAELARSPQEVRAHVERLLSALVDRLSMQRLGAERLLLTFGEFRNGRKGFRRLTLGAASPMLDLKRWLRLIGERAAVFDPADGVESVEIRALVAPLEGQQLGFDGKTSQDSLDQLVEQLSARLGEDRLVRFARGDSHLPEEAWHPISALQNRTSGKREQEEAGAKRLRRPLTLFTRPRQVEVQADRHPEKMRWRGETHKIVRATGPERIVPPWWQAQDLEVGVARDYWRIETKRGERFWLYQSQDALGNWYLQGRFA